MQSIALQNIVIVYRVFIRHIIMSKGLSISGLTINLNVNFIRLIYYQKMLVARSLKKGNH